MPLQFSSRSHKILFWSLLVLAVAMVLAVAFALRGFNREMRKEDMTPNPSGLSGDNTTTAPLSETMTEDILMGWKRADKGRVSVMGEVLSINTVPEQTGVKGMELSLNVHPVADPIIYPAPDKVYHFFLSEQDTEGFSQTFKTGETLTVTAQAAPREDAYVIATKVEKGEGMVGEKTTREMNGEKE